MPDAIAPDGSETHRGRWGADAPIRRRSAAWRRFVAGHAQNGPGGAGPARARGEARRSGAVRGASGHRGGVGAGSGIAYVSLPAIARLTGRSSVSLLATTPNAASRTRLRPNSGTLAGPKGRSAGEMVLW